MGSLANRNRCVWQTYGGTKANGAELSVKEVFEKAFESTEFEYISHPTDFNKCYVNIQLDEEEQREVYNPQEKINKHGINPDGLIMNKITGKKIYVEIKRQDGWVKGKTRSAGRGNAHERLCKYFTPGLLNLLRKETNITKKNTLPFWIIFLGDITKDPCRVREIKFWFTTQYKVHYFFWRDTQNPNLLLQHFDKYIDPLLK